MRRIALLLLAVLAAAAPAPARLGETLAQLKERYGRPRPQVRKDTAIWLFEAEDETGELLFTVTFNDAGLSIAEGLKPLQRAKFTTENAESFIDVQIGPFRKSPTLHYLKTGTPYKFGGKSFTAGPHESIVIDEPHDVLIIWNQAGVPSIVAVSSAMMR